MAQTNQVIENPVIGDKLKFLVTAEDSQGELLKIEIRTKSGAKGTPNHYHPQQTEAFEVIQGKLGIFDNGKTVLLKAGEKYTIEPNSLHRWWPEGDNDLLIHVEVKPAMKTEYFLETMYALAKQGKVNKEALPGPLQFAAILNECYGELFVENPPVPVQKFMANVVGRMAKYLGYKGYVPFPQN